VGPIFEAVLANGPSGIEAIAARTPGAAAQRMEDDIFVAELPHMLYRGGTPLHLAAAALRYDAARALLAAGAPVSTVNRRGATALHYACDPRPSSAGSRAGRCEMRWPPGSSRVRRRGADHLAAPSYDSARSVSLPRLLGTTSSSWLVRPVRAMVHLVFDRNGAKA
jgi:hypothetical protein